MFAFQWKNLLDSVYFDDGLFLIFVIHHSVVIVVSLFATHPFQGIDMAPSSSACRRCLPRCWLLSLCSMPSTGWKSSSGTSRIHASSLAAFLLVSFFIVRGVIWPYLTYFYCRDGFRMSGQRPGHPQPVPGEALSWAACSHSMA